MQWACHPELVEGRRAQRPVRVLSMVLRPLPASWFDKLTMTAPPLSLLLQILQDFTTRSDRENAPVNYSPVAPR
jgi:hypothetical protein